ncbi:PIG-L family deacetylase [Limnospira fusiformis KN01]|uniref:PIG-L deacetylase family protein n=1 Tax=Limnospira TaxID=2596745 RepID=UPI001658B74F|nr:MULTISPECIES: PIG-L family deacetylase [Limnospira]MDT9198036.1 PIG-L family deacetylase [Limnospira sp. PMC 1042.18]ULB45183.1 PIG-L family deacetylase [Limnospira fusiformis KN01]
MQSSILIVAPHPDDETLGCGGTLLHHIANGDKVHWLIVTDICRELGFTELEVGQRQTEIQQVSEAYGFAGVYNLKFPPARLDTLPRAELISAISHFMKNVMPEIVYLPYRGDVHTDHAVVFDAVVSCTKWFRYPFIRRVLCYETLSETDFGLNPESRSFTPNSFVNITKYIDKKIEIAKIYQTEMGEFPFPRSHQALQALAKVRGAACGCLAAESFLLLREIVK